MKLLTWNLNSIRARRERLISLLRRHQPDVVCLQETRTTDELFSQEEIGKEGFHSSHAGQLGGRNGVAILSKKAQIDVERGFPGDPIADQARVLSATVDGIRVISVYVVNGQSLGSTQYQLKLNWLDMLGKWINRCASPGDSLILAGDFNIAPRDSDVSDPEAWQGKVLVSQPERDRLHALQSWGLIDLATIPATGDPDYSWWDHRRGSFRRDLGLRIDLVLATKSLADRCVELSVDRWERNPKSSGTKPSDHAPVIARFD